jgi:hypothetical protein
MNAVLTKRAENCLRILNESEKFSREEKQEICKKIDEALRGADDTKAYVLMHYAMADLAAKEWETYASREGLKNQTTSALQKQIFIDGFILATVGKFE